MDGNVESYMEKNRGGVKWFIKTCYEERRLSGRLGQKPAQSSKKRF